jgi:hypothetical protein
MLSKFAGGGVPRFFLHIDELDTDPDGTELPELEAARREAMLSAREMLAERILLGAETIPMRILITDEAGNLLAVVHMRDVLPLALRNCKD